MSGEQSRERAARAMLAKLTAAEKHVLASLVEPDGGFGGADGLDASLRMIGLALAIIANPELSPEVARLLAAEVGRG